jgi:hypothetical protein
MICSRNVTTHCYDFFCSWTRKLSIYSVSFVHFGYHQQSQLICFFTLHVREKCNLRSSAVATIQVHRQQPYVSYCPYFNKYFRCRTRLYNILTGPSTSHSSICVPKSRFRHRHLLRLWLFVHYQRVCGCPRQQHRMRSSSCQVREGWIRLAVLAHCFEASPLTCHRGAGCFHGHA